MKTINLYFQVHQPYRLRTYRFFDMGHEHHYYDDYANREILCRIARNTYLPANEILMKHLEAHHNKFRVTFSISGSAISQFQEYCPEVLMSFRQLAATGKVEFLAETYSHSLSALRDKHCFAREVRKHQQAIENIFGQKPRVFRNTELIYSEEIAQRVHGLGFTAMYSEGGQKILGAQSPNQLAYSGKEPRMRLFLRNDQLSDDISFRFSDTNWSEYPLYPHKYLRWLTALPKKDDLINLCMDYETFGEHQKQETGIHDFLDNFILTVIRHPGLQFRTPTEILKNQKPQFAFHAPFPVSWADTSRDLSAWLGNDMQHEACDKLYALYPLMQQTQDHNLWYDWERLLNSDHFYYMATKFFTDAQVHDYFNPYPGPYEAFMNYMNILSDFTDRLQTVLKEQAQPDNLDTQIAYHEAALRSLRLKQGKKKLTQTSDLI